MECGSWVCAPGSGAFAHMFFFFFFPYIGSPPTLRPWVKKVLFMHMVNKIMSQHLLQAILTGDRDMASHIYNTMPVMVMVGHSNAMYYFTADPPVRMGVLTQPPKFTGVILQHQQTWDISEL